MTTHQRLMSVDALRGLAMVLMVQQHLGIWLVDRQTYARDVQAGLAYVNMTGALAAPLFVTLAGIATGLTRLEPKVLSTRGLLLVLFGGVLNLLVPSWFSWGSFYVLHLLGVWLLLCGASGARLDEKKESAWVPLLALLVLVGAVLGQHFLNTPLNLTNPMLRDLSKPGGALRLALWEGQFPLFPWLSLCLGGLWAARAVKLGRSKPLFLAGAICAVLALLCRALVHVVPLAAYVRPWRFICRVSFFPMSSFAALGLFSLCLLITGLFLRLEQMGKISADSWLVPLGRTSLTALFFHVVTFREGLERLHLRHTLPPHTAMAAIVAFIVLWVVLARRWARFDYRYGLEWWLRKLSSR